ncbi:hypothetical protein BS78_09G016400 [Paspalum vaginatum]|nr:hypothetical protein BS78_09G016400 [Paspalum vaginatum]
MTMIVIDHAGCISNLPRAALSAIYAYAPFSIQGPPHLGPLSILQEWLCKYIQYTRQRNGNHKFQFHHLCLSFLRKALLILSGFYWHFFNFVSYVLSSQSRYTLLNFILYTR